MDWGHSLRLVAPEELLSLAGLVLLLVAAWAGDKASRAITWAAVATLAVCAVLVAPALCSGASGPDTVAFFGQFRADGFASFAKLLIYAAGGASLIVAPAFFERENAMRAEYPILILFAVLGMGMMVSAADLITLYLGLELNSLSAYVLAAFLRSDDRSAEAGLKYFVLGALASGILLFGMSLTYGFTGTTSFEGISAALQGNGSVGGLSHGALFGITFMLAGLAFKISAVPFHMWTPDVYEGAPTPVTAFFASAPKVAAVLLATRVCLGALGPAIEAWRQIVIVVALASILLGAVAAYGQTNIKRLLAYSSINNVGFALIGLAAGGLQGASSVLFYMAVYLVMTLGAFLCVLRLRGEDGEPLEQLSALSGLSQARPGLAAALAFFMFSLAGIPPFLGFWSKLAVFIAAVHAGLIWVAVIGILGTVVGAYYYLKVVKILYFDAPAAPLGRVRAPLEGALIAVAAIFVSPLGYLLIGPITRLTGNAASSLF